MNCDLIIEDLQAFLDDELQATRRSEIDLHLKSCKECSQMVNELGDLSNLLRSCDVPTPNLPTGQEILAKTNFKTSNTRSSLSQFFVSVYEFLFKYKAPVLATMSVMAVVAVAINITGVKEGTFSGFSSNAPVSPQVAMSEKTLKEDVAIDEPRAISQEAKTENNQAIQNKAKSETPTSSLESVPSNAAKNVRSEIQGEAEKTVQGGAQELKGGNTYHDASGIVPPAKSPSSIPPLPPPPAELAAEPQRSKLEQGRGNKSEARDELGKTEPEGRAIVIDKGSIAKEENIATLRKQPSQTSANQVSEDTTIAKPKDNKANVLTDAPKSASLGRTVPTESNGEKKRLDNEVASKEADGNKPSVPKIAARPAADPKPSFAGKGLDSHSSGAMSPSPVIGKREAEPKTKKQVIKLAQIVIEAKELKPAKERLNQIVNQQLGRLKVSESSEFLKVTIEVPAVSFDSTMVELRKLGNVMRETTNDKIITTDDVEGQIEDTKKLGAKEDKDRDNDKNAKEQSPQSRSRVEMPTSIINLVIQVKKSQ